MTDRQFKILCYFIWLIARRIPATKFSTDWDYANRITEDEE